MNPFSGLIRAPSLIPTKSPRCCGMSKTHAARQLLSLGPLTKREFIEITGWKIRQCEEVIHRMRRNSEIVVERNFYKLVAA